MRKLLFIILSILISDGVLKSQNIPTNGLVAWYPFNGNANDQSGNSLNGTLNGASLTTDRYGNPNAAYFFDGIDDFIEVAHNPLLNFDANDDFTISVWVQANPALSNDLNAEIIAKWNDFPGGNNDPYPYAIRMWTGSNPGKIRMMRYDKNCSNFPVMESSQTILNGDWYNLTYRKTGSLLEMMVDGIVIETLTDNTSCNTTNTNPLYIGKRGGTINLSPFHGKIDDIAFYNRSLPDCELIELLDFKLDQKLFAHYPLDGNANDVSGNNFNGNVIGSVLTTDRNGNPNSAYAFDGVDDFISVGPTIDVSKLFGMTISAWFYSETIGGLANRFVGISIGTKETGEIGVRIRSENDLRFSTMFAGGRSTANAFNGHEAFSGLYSYNNWVHVTATHRDGRSDIYINGEYVNTNTQVVGTGGKFNFISPLEELLMGKALSDGNSERYFHGRIDEVRLYNRVLNDCEIRKLYNPNALPVSDTTLQFCNSDNIILSKPGFTDYQWFSNGNLISTNSTLQFDDSLSNNITLLVKDQSCCPREFNFNLEVGGRDSEYFFLGKCKKDSFLLNTSENLNNIQWYKNGSLIASNTDSVIIRDTTSVIISLSGNDTAGCLIQDTFLITSFRPVAEPGEYDQLLCRSNLNQKEYELIGNGFSQFQWFISGGIIIKNEGLNIEVNWTDLSDIDLRVVETTREGCVGDTIDFPFEIDSSNIHLDLVSFSEDFKSIEFYGQLSSFENFKNVKLISDDLDTSLTASSNQVEIEIDTSSLWEENLFSFSIMDACENQLLSNSLQPILLHSELRKDQTSILLSWENYNGWDDSDIRNSVYEYKAGSRDLISSIESETEMYIPYKENDFRKCFYLESYNENHDLLSRSNLLCVELEGELFIPNVITPNNDGYNDCFVIPNLDQFDKNHLKIYNRYGILVYQSEAYSGIWCAEDMTSGTYFYHLILNDGSVNYKGFIEVLR